LLISDPSSGAGVILASTRIRGILRGAAAGEVQINNLTADSRIKPGEQVLTSGGDLVFPRGIPVGRIESIAPDPQHQPYTAISIKPAANLTELEEVLVITGTQSNLTPSAQQDAAAAQQRADEMKRAADLVAEKLPSIHPDEPIDPNNPSAPDTPAGGTAGAPSTGIPHPKPALHPDRYSPNDSPPAESLTPGAAAPASSYTPPPRAPRSTPKQTPTESTPTTSEPPQED
jgi:rod shape-determining protein MreC